MFLNTCGLLRTNCFSESDAHIPKTIHFEEQIQQFVGRDQRVHEIQRAAVDAQGESVKIHRV
jgi:hypothetical protein